MRLPGGPGVRVDTGVAEGDAIAPDFDSMIAKVIAHGRDRTEALGRLRRALYDMALIVRGGANNKGFMLDLLARPEIVSGDVDVDWLDRLVVADEHVPTRYAEEAVLGAGARPVRRDRGDRAPAVLRARGSRASPVPVVPGTQDRAGLRRDAVRAARASARTADLSRRARRPRDGARARVPRQYRDTRPGRWRAVALPLDRRRRSSHHRGRGHPPPGQQRQRRRDSVARAGGGLVHRRRGGPARRGRRAGRGRRGHEDRDDPRRAILGHRPEDPGGAQTPRLAPGRH